MSIPSPHDPFRAPDWRSRRCESLIDRDERPTRQDDSATLCGWQYLIDLRRCRDDVQRDRVALDHSALNAAYTLHARTGDMRRMGLEGFLLAAVPPEEIDTRFGLLPGTSRCYAEQFFDIFDCLQAPDYIINVVIGLHGRELTERDAEVFLRLYGFLGGRHVVDAFLDYFYAPLWLPLLLRSVTPEDLERFRQRLQVLLTILMDCLPLRSTTLRQWLELQILMKRADQKKPPEWTGLRVALSGLLLDSETSSPPETGHSTQSAMPKTA